MRMYDLIKKKREGGILKKEEISFIISEYVKGTISDYQMSAFLMAAFIRGLDEEEVADLTEEMAISGEMIDLSSIEGIKVDKHSTGGVGDKTSLLLGPIVAACGGKVAKMSGRGLGHTGGTVDKLESIPHMRTMMSDKEFIRIVNQIGLCVIGQTSELAPADKMIYALRDVTATVDSIPLIAASIMSKKIASGADAIVLDVKVGSGAFMKTLEDALQLAKEMVRIGSKHKKKMIALLTDMDKPLGNAIGNALEVKEVIETLKGQGPSDLVEEAIELAGNMLFLSEKGSLQECKEMAEKALKDGRALQKFKEMIDAQGGDSGVVEDPSLLPNAKYSYRVLAKEGGFIVGMDAEQCGIVSTMLGAGRLKKEDPIDFGAGIILHKKTGDFVLQGEVLATLYTNQETSLPEASKLYEKAISIHNTQGKMFPSILARVTSDNCELYVSPESYDQERVKKENEHLNGSNHRVNSHLKEGVTEDALRAGRNERVYYGGQENDKKKGATNDKVHSYTSELGVAMDKEKELANQTPIKSEMEVFLEKNGVDDVLIKWLIDRALEAKAKAYVPYSHFAVGATLLSKDGNLYKGCNVENASYGLTNCAERTAIYSAIANGSEKFRALTIVSDAEELCSPCGACRQVISEFDIPIIIMANSKKEFMAIRAEDLLPHAFTLEESKK